MTRYAHARRRIFPFCALALVLAGMPPAAAAPTATLTIFAAGTLAAPFRAIDDAFMREHPEVKIEAQFGGSVKMVKQVTELHRQADVVAVADYSVIPKYFFGRNGGKAYSDWYAGFATNAVTFVYTPRSRFADRIGAKNWYQLLSQPGVEIGRSNPDTDPSGYQTVQMLSLAERYYREPGLAERILANAPKTNMRDTETELIAALQSGQIDYLAIYRSDARQHKFRYLELPPQIDLGDAKYSGFYSQGVAHTANGTLTGKPIVYAVTIPFDAPQREWAVKYVQFLLGPKGRAVIEAKGFGAPARAMASDAAKMPAELRSMVVPWPKSP
ncbi:MAG TPA: tungstate ABC transporter substrate-binding protein WtpA [Usitatibacter sp.]|nr:tungstate ABC transporter substrate-binding protein WtpA [Usitatibacter sp.]